VKKPTTLSFELFERALKTLEDAVAIAPRNDLERDGVIQRFEYTFEMTWKSVRSFLFALGRADVSNSPKPILRDALEENLINDIEKWFDFLKARNASTHTYNEPTADEVYKLAIQFPSEARILLQKMKEKLKKI
jgi:nucleotidyltransferase substrate binding protein (TIGR01987 family)